MYFTLSVFILHISKIIMFAKHIHVTSLKFVCTMISLELYSTFVSFGTSLIACRCSVDIIWNLKVYMLQCKFWKKNGFWFDLNWFTHLKMKCLISFQLIHITYKKKYRNNREKITVTKIEFIFYLLVDTLIFLKAFRSWLDTCS